MPREPKRTTIVLRVSDRVARILLGHWARIYEMSDPWDFLNGPRVAARAQARRQGRRTTAPESRRAGAVGWDAHDGVMAVS